MKKPWYKRIRDKLRPMDERTKEFHKTLADEAYIEGYTKGHKTGVASGFAAGKLEGIQIGNRVGYESGYSDGRVDMAEYMRKEA